MTKIELENKIKKLREQLTKAEEELEKMNTVFYIDNKYKPFIKWNIKEQQDLYNINQKAWEWLTNNKECSIIDYNDNTIKQELKVNLYK